MQAFSSAVAELYERAAYAGPREFHAEAVQLMHRLIGFDGAILGIGNADTTLAKILVINDAIASVRGEYTGVPTRSLISPTFFSNPVTPAACDAKELDGKLAVPRWHDFTRKHGIRKLLLYGDLPADRDNGRWIALYRSGETCFQHSEAELLQALWPHFRQATTFNLGRALYRSDPNRITHPVALVNSGGLVETVSKPMVDLLKVEWPDFNERSLPAVAVASLIQSGKYRGTRIELTGSLKSGYMVCVAKRIPLTIALTRSEMNVAHRFARGMTHKEIAAHLNVSPHTVRNQLAHVYMKLGVHGKVELARLIHSA